jgi:hypothetical protein
MIKSFKPFTIGNRGGNFSPILKIPKPLAAMDLIALPSRVVEPMIAASPVFVGAENFPRNGEPKGRRLLAFGFGLIHGCGFTERSNWR